MKYLNTHYFEKRFTRRSIDMYMVQRFITLKESKEWLYSYLIFGIRKKDAISYTKGIRGIRKLSLIRSICYKQTKS